MLKELWQNAPVTSEERGPLIRQLIKGGTSQRSDCLSKTQGSANT